MTYAIGEFDQRIGLQSKTLTRDGAGGATDSWSAYATVWALVRPMTGRERQNAMRAEALSDYLVVIRYRSGVVEGHRIDWNGRTLNIRFIKNHGPRSQWLEIEAEMGAAS